MIPIDLDAIEQQVRDGKKITCDVARALNQHYPHMNKRDFAELQDRLHRATNMAIIWKRFHSAKTLLEQLDDITTKFGAAMGPAALLNTQDEQGNTLAHRLLHDTLELAQEHGWRDSGKDFNVIALMVRHGLNPILPNNQGMTVYEYLLEAEQHRNAPSFPDRKLHKALLAIHESADFPLDLLIRDTTPEAVMQSRSRIAQIAYEPTLSRLLHSAVEVGNVPLLPTLLAQGAQPSTKLRHPQHRNAFHTAAYNLRDDAAETLTDHIKKNNKDHGEGLIHLALTLQHDDKGNLPLHAVFKTLLARKAEGSLDHHPTAFKHAKHLVEHYINHGARRDARNLAGETPTEMAHEIGGEFAQWFDNRERGGFMQRVSGRITGRVASR